MNRAVLVERIAELVNEKDHHRHHRHPRRVGREHPRRHRAQARRHRQGRHQQSLQAHRAGNQLRRQRAGHRSWPAQDARPQGADQLLHRAPPRGGDAPHAVSNCGKPRNAPKSSKAISSRCPTWMSSSASSAVSNNRDEARIKLLAFDFTRAQVERFGILIRSEARLTNGRYAFSESAGQRDPRTAPLPIDRPGNRQGRKPNTRNCSSASRTCWTSWPRKRACWPSSRPS